MKPKGRMYQATTQVNVLSPEIYHVVEADVFHDGGRQNYSYRLKRGMNSLPGSEAVA